MTPAEKFRQWLTDRTSRCAVCLTDAPEVKYWRDHPVLERVFICSGCAPVRREKIVSLDTKAVAASVPIGGKSLAPAGSGIPVGWIG